MGNDVRVKIHTFGHRTKTNVSGSIKQSEHFKYRTSSLRKQNYAFLLNS